MVREQIDRETEKLLAAGIIRESTSPYCAPIVLVKKKDGIRYCCCVDYRLLYKKVLFEASWPLANIQDHLRQFDKPKVFSSLDLLSGYFQVPGLNRIRNILHLLMVGDILSLIASPKGPKTLNLQCHC